MLNVIRKMTSFGWTVEFYELSGKSYARAHYKNNTKKEVTVSGNTLEDAIHLLGNKICL